MNVPKKYKERFVSLEFEAGLDGCKYMLYFADGWSWDGYSCVPVRSKQEALKFIREASQ